MWHYTESQGMSPVSRIIKCPDNPSNTAALEIFLFLSNQVDTTCKLIGPRPKNMFTKSLL